MIEKLESCTLCPHNCKINRLEGKFGRCKSGANGSGTIFFSNCNLSCMFCQNYEISQEQKGKEISIEQLANIFIEQQKKGANNINLVTPTSYVYHIIEALDIAKKQGLKIPVIYNTNGYENEETIDFLKGYIDVYLPDLKYYDNKLAKKYSNIDNYFEISTKAIKKMKEQVGENIFDENGLIQKGMIIRHLVLPNSISNSKNILKWINENMPKNTYISVMAQYFPTYRAKSVETLNRKLTKEEYKEIENYLYSLDIENGYIQELGEHEEEYVPNFDLF